MQIKYNGDIINISKKTKVIDLFKKDIEQSNNNIIACKFNNEVKPLDYEINSDGQIELIDLKNKDGMRIYRRGLIYIVGKAFNELYKEALLTVNFQLSHSLFCEVDNMEVTEEMIEKINKKVKEIVEKNLEITKKIMSKEDAKEFYKKEKTLRGILQIDLEEKKEVTLYYCEDYYNYFYGVMPISTGYMKHYEILKYYDGFLLRYPSSNNPKILPEFKESKKLLETLKEYEEVHKILKINTLYKLNSIIKANKIKQYILLDEALHEKKIAGIADNIAKNKNLKVILIAGPSSSRKNNICKKVRASIIIKSD